MGTAANPQGCAEVPGEAISGRIVSKRVRWRELEFDGGCASFIRDISTAGRLPAARGDFVTEIPIAGIAINRK